MDSDGYPLGRQPPRLLEYRIVGISITLPCSIPGSL
jgi:hypothetical protein